jgi:hypothetical protein
VVRLVQQVVGWRGVRAERGEAGLGHEADVVAHGARRREEEAVVDPWLERPVRDTSQWEALTTAPEELAVNRHSALDAEAITCAAPCAACAESACVRDTSVSAWRVPFELRAMRTCGQQDQHAQRCSLQRWGMCKGRRSAARLGHLDVGHRHLSGL